MSNILEMQSGRFLLRAYAKLNLFLNIIGKNYLSYHLLESYFARIDVYDEIEITLSDYFTCCFKKVDIDENNTITKAVKLLEAFSNRQIRASISIKKHIPIGGGMGGGSSNAASVILALNQILDLGISYTNLLEIANEVGADVSFFMQSNNAFVSGIGNKITPMHLGIDLPLLVVNPNIFTPTALIYKASVSEFSSPIFPITTENIIKQIFNGGNALEEPAFLLFPQIKDLIALLSNLEGCLFARMSGSGSTCFAVFSSPNTLLDSYKKLKQQYPKFWLYQQILRI